MTTKPCTRCNEAKPLSCFGRNKKAADGHRGDCKQCRNAHIRAQREERGYAPQTVKRATLHAQIAAGFRPCITCGEAKGLDAYASSSRHPGGVFPECKPCARERASAWLNANRKRAAEAQRIRYTRKRKSILAAQHAYYQRNSPRIRAYVCEWAKANPDKVAIIAHRRRARKVSARGSFTPADVVRIWHRQRGECFWCECRIGKRPADRTYHVDHITALARGGSNWPHNLCLACPACNHSKGGRQVAAFRYRHLLA